ncbi:hypothetical protein [Candidatus Poriferisodalis sp.]|uniref:hypothetical protein n=1 Tax=Candidatus Poriferisodalis sp. TaxID=3101277 RepID=UPI003B599C93
MAGATGVGKSTLARQVGAHLALPYVEIDALYHGPEWQPRPTFRDDVIALAAEDQWVTEWQYPVAPPSAGRACRSSDLSRLAAMGGDLADRAANTAAGAAPNRALEWKS